MNDKEWNIFFDLLNKIVDLPMTRLAEKIRLVKEKAQGHGENTEMNLDEFTSWNFDC